MREKIMSYLTAIMAFLKKSEASTKCPICNKYSSQSVSKRSHGQTMLCPYCKSLFIKEK
ncbi:YnfU family zinc-binding protein [Pantoea sp. MBD-2R]|uniref:YnfU family zinc-binding protein n=1 Tax=Pantoea sp. MBD-2R TaxID=3141540 RepID=UPI003183978E